MGGEKRKKERKKVSCFFSFLISSSSSSSFEEEKKKKKTTKKTLTASCCANLWNALSLPCLSSLVRCLSRIIRSEAPDGGSLKATSSAEPTSRACAARKAPDSAASCAVIAASGGLSLRSAAADKK